CIDDLQTSHLFLDFNQPLNCTNKKVLPPKSVPLYITIFIACLFIILLTAIFVYAYRHQKFPFSRLHSGYRMGPLKYNRVYMSTTEELTSADNVMLVTT
ncbi:unnamed protein product, partial [Didymodactylos carnosus]